MFAKDKKEILSIPNILSMFRIALIIVFVILFFLDLYVASAIVLAVSGLTDILDGFIARKFNMVTNLGKALDPFADKLTQFAVLICLVKFNMLILIPFGILVLRDGFMLASGISIFKRTHETFSAKWFGKVATAFTYLLMGSMLMFKGFFDENPVLLNVLIIVDAAIILFSFIMYAARNYIEIKRLDKEEQENQK